MYKKKTWKNVLEKYCLSALYTVQDDGVVVVFDFSYIFNDHCSMHRRVLHRISKHKTR